MKTKLKIKFTDFYDGFIWNGHCLYKYLNQYFELELSDTPDIIIYSCYGTEFLKYSCPRIFYTAENIRPNFRFCDFAVSFDYNNNKNHFRLPLYSVYFTNQNLTKRRDAKALLHKKTGFCSFVVSNATESEKRINFFHELSKYKQVSSGGKYANNVGGPVENKRDFISRYLFNIAFENSSYPGYTTEKIAEPWLEGCIPIYWGDPEIARDINPDCFINMHNFNSFDSAITYIKEVDASPELQIKYLSAPFFRNNKVPDHLKDEVIAKNLKYFIDKCLDGVPNKAAKFWHKPYYYLRKIRGGSRLIEINLR
ncbi:glycosyltransferase family 10 [Flavobacteriaceae bacterium]|nr:glycosyltransferase family 10 [Flavobacteriaceae bacterium]